MAVDTMNMSVVAHVLDVRHNDEEVYLSCFNSEVERSVPAMKLPMHSDLFAFRLNVPLLCCFNLRLFTRERHTSSTQSRSYDADLSPVCVEIPRHGQAAPGSACFDGHVGGLSTARPACSRVLRVEPLTHTVMTSPGWRTLLITWNDYMQNWIKTEMDGDDLLLLMQFPAGEIGRKVALTVTPHVDDNDVTTPDKFHAREFPVGTECFWANIPLSGSTVDLRYTARLVDKACGSEVIYHPRLVLSHPLTSSSRDPDSSDRPVTVTRGLVASCQLDTNGQHVIAPVLYELKRPTFALSRT